MLHEIPISRDINTTSVPSTRGYILETLHPIKRPVDQKYCHTGEVSGRDAALCAASARTHDDICGSGIGSSGFSDSTENCVYGVSGRSLGPGLSAARYPAVPAIPGASSTSRAFPVQREGGSCPPAPTARCGFAFSANGWSFPGRKGMFLAHQGRLRSAFNNAFASADGALSNTSDLSCMAMRLSGAELCDGCPWLGRSDDVEWRCSLSEGSKETRCTARGGS
jgi:hypothetical protein